MKLLTASLLLVAMVVVVNAHCHRHHRPRWGKRDLAYEQNLPDDCTLEIDIPSRGQNEGFDVCLKCGNVWTSRDVSSCTGSKAECADMSELDDLNVARFLETFPGAYAEVCQEPSGELCLYTDVAYSTHTMASEDDDEICVTLSDGKVECSPIPEDMIQSLNQEVKMSARFWPRIQQFIRNR